jgi:CBS-domain-containing membrane protein
MIATEKTILELTAGDLMTRDLVCLPLEMSMKQAARLLWQNQISGAPVVDSNGQCVGVISATDFVALTKNGAKRHPSVNTEWEVVELEKLPEDEIGQYMTADPVMVSPSTGICRLARQMVDAHIHRTIVVDSENKPIGIVSSTDLLATLAHAESFH